MTAFTRTPTPHALGRAMDPWAAGLDDRAEAVCESLAQAFGLRRPVRPKLPGATPIGLEIEAPHSACFPAVWSRWGLGSRRVADLKPSELAAFGAELAAAEAPLRELLDISVQCGVPRGNDRFWEFALDPVLDLGLAWEQTELLSAAGLLPRQRPLSLQATLGGLAADDDCRFLARMVEILHVDPARIAAGAAATRAVIFTGWGRKGVSGVLEKNAGELLGRAPRAVELRTPQLPSSSSEWTLLAQLLSAGADAIADRQAGLPTERAHWFGLARRATEQALASAGLPASDWWRPPGGGSIDHGAWSLYAQALPRLRPQLESTARAFPEPSASFPSARSSATRPR